MQCPGTNAGTEQLPAGNYDPGQLVSYSCTQAGFELSESSPLLCEISGCCPATPGNMWKPLLMKGGC